MLSQLNQMESVAVRRNTYANHYIQRRVSNKILSNNHLNSREGFYCEKQKEELENINFFDVKYFLRKIFYAFIEAKIHFKLFMKIKFVKAFYHTSHLTNAR